MKITDEMLKAACHYINEVADKGNVVSIPDIQGMLEAALSAQPQTAAEQEDIGPHEKALRDAVEPFLAWLEQREEGAHIKEVREGLIGVEDVLPDNLVVLGAHLRSHKDQGVLTIGHFRRLQSVYDGKIPTITAAPAHVLYNTGDADAPDVIKDRNGEIVLDLCKVCWKGEIELREPCTAPAQEPAAKIVSSHGDPEAFGERELVALIDVQKLPYGTKLYLTPPDQSARIAELEAALKPFAEMTIDGKLPNTEEATSKYPLFAARLLAAQAALKGKGE